MHENIWFVAAIWMGLAFLASLISIRVGISVALIEIVVGVAAGNIHFAGGQHILQTTDWTNFLAMLGSGVLTFLAGAEIDPVSLRANLRASMTIGVLSFLLPFVCVWLFAQFVLGWPLHQAQIAGMAPSLPPRKARRCCRLICLALPSPGSFCATKRSSAGCAASRSPFSRRFTSSKPDFLFHCQRFGRHWASSRYCWL